MATRAQVQGREKEFKEKFGILDTSGDHRLQFHEIMEFLKKEGPAVNDRQAMIMFSRIDRDGSGSIGFSEFCDYVMSLELLAARKSAMKSRVLRQWDGPAQLKVDGSWDRETKLALQEFLSVQRTPTSRVVKPSQFVNGSLSAKHIIVLQELLDMCKLPTTVAESSQSLACGIWDGRTTRALHELLLLQGAPTAVAIGDKFISQPRSKNTVFALQEFLAMMRKTKGMALGAVR